MRMNPVKRGLVTHPKDRSWSSFSFYSKTGHRWFRMDSDN
jgi:hypothetical protein